MGLRNDTLIKRRDYLTELITYIDQRSADAPGGSLRVSSKNGNPSYYIRKEPTDRTGTYIRKSDMHLAKALAQRDYLKKVRECASAEENAINELLNVLQAGTVEDVYSGLILPRKELVTPVAVSNEEYAKQWLAKPYKRKGFEASDPEIYADNGERVRSKSEILLFKAFDSYSIPAKYEVPLRLWNGKIIHPDFDLLNVRTREEFWWEHFGKADKPDYMKYNVGRLNDLILSGYYPGINLIITFETENKPLDMRVVHALIKRFLL